MLVVSLSGIPANCCGLYGDPRW